MTSSNNSGAPIPLTRCSCEHEKDFKRDIIIKRTVRHRREKAITPSAISVSSTRYFAGKPTLCDRAPKALARRELASFSFDLITKPRHFECRQGATADILRCSLGLFKPDGNLIELWIVSACQRKTGQQDHRNTATKCRQADGYCYPPRTGQSGESPRQHEGSFKSAFIPPHLSRQRFRRYLRMRRVSL